MTILKELFSVLNEKKVEDEQYFVTVGTGKKFDLFTERGFPSFEAARKFVRSSLSAIQNDRDSDTDDADDEAEQLENAEIMSGSQLKKKYPKLFEAAEPTDPYKREDDYRYGWNFGREVKRGEAGKLTDKDKEKYSPSFLRGYEEGRKMNEAKDEDDDCVSRQCHAQAAAKSKKEGVVQHINKDKRTGKLYVSDWFDDDETVATYNKGKISEALKPNPEGTEAWQHGYDDAKNAKTDSSKPSRAKLYFNKPALMKKYEEGSREYETAMKRKAHNEKNPIKEAVRARMTDFSKKPGEQVRDAETPAERAELAQTVRDNRARARASDAHPNMKRGASSGQTNFGVNSKFESGRNAKTASVRNEEFDLTEARSIPSWFQDGAKVKLMPEYADKDPNEVFTLKSVDTETGKARIADDQGKGWNISYYQVYPKNKTPAIHEAYGSFDGGKRAFKRAEMEFELGHEDREEKNRTFTPVMYGIEINGKVWMKDGAPVSFRSKATAEKAIENSRAMSGKNAKAVPLKEDKAMQGLGKLLAGKTAAPAKDEDAGPAVDASADASAEVTEPTDKPSDTEVTGDADDQQTSAEFKVGDVVKTLVGPHKGEQHDVVKVHADGRMDLKPKGIEGTAVKYRNGGVTAKPEQVVLAESIIRGSKSLLRTITIDLTEAAKDGMMPLSYKPGKGHKIEAYGRKGMKNVMWRKCFKDSAALEKWCDENDATVEGSRDLEKDELR